MELVLLVAEVDFSEAGIQVFSSLAALSAVVVVALLVAVVVALLVAVVAALLAVVVVA